ncbi:hypothetical protein Tco_0933897, partial [Tanacetum coccineum]
KSVCHNGIKNDLRKLKGKDIVDNADQMSNATTIAPGMYNLDPVILAPKVKNNRKAHEYYLKHTVEQVAILREVVEQATLRNPSASASYSACMYVKLIQELLGYVRDICPDIHKPRVKPSTSANGSKPLSNTKNDRISQTPSSNENNKVEVLKPFVLTFTLVGNTCPLTRITTTNKVRLRVPIPLKVVAPEHVVTRVYTRRPKVPKSVPKSKPKVAKSITANRMKPGTSRGSDTSVAPSSSSLLAVKFDNDQVVKIMRYGDYQIGNVTISRVYYMKGLGHNLFSAGQFYDSDLEVAFRKHTCFVHNLEGVDLLLGSRGTNMYSLSHQTN